MDTTGPASWEKILQEMDQKTLGNIAVINPPSGVRAEKWPNLNLKHLKFPQVTVSSVKRAIMIQQFQADFIRHQGIVSPAAIYAKAVIAGMQRDLPVYCRRDSETTKKDWTGRAVEEERRSRAEATINAQLQAIGIPQECWDLAQMLRRDPPVRLILMTAYHRLLPVKRTTCISMLKSPLWALPGVSTLMSAFDKTLAAFNLNNQRGKALSD